MLQLNVKIKSKKKLGREKFVEVLPTRRCWLYIKKNRVQIFFRDKLHENYKFLNLCFCKNWSGGERLYQ